MNWNEVLWQASQALHQLSYSNIDLLDLEKTIFLEKLTFNFSYQTFPNYKNQAADRGQVLALFEAKLLNKLLQGTLAVKFKRFTLDETPYQPPF